MSLRCRRHRKCRESCAGSEGVGKFALRQSVVLGSLATLQFRNRVFYVDAPTNDLAVEVVFGFDDFVGKFRCPSPLRGHEDVGKVEALSDSEVSLVGHNGHLGIDKGSGSPGPRESGQVVGGTGNRSFDPDERPPVAGDDLGVHCVVVAMRVVELLLGLPGHWSAYGNGRAIDYGVTLIGGEGFKLGEQIVFGAHPPVRGRRDTQAGQKRKHLGHYTVGSVLAHPKGRTQTAKSDVVAKVDKGEEEPSAEGNLVATARSDVAYALPGDQLAVTSPLPLRAELDHEISELGGSDAGESAHLGTIEIDGASRIRTHGDHLPTSIHLIGRRS